MHLQPPPPVPVTKIESLDPVLERLEAQGRPFDPDLLRRVYGFSADMHRDQVRRSGEPYLFHPLAVSYLLADLKFDQTCVATGLLHDVLEDTLTTRDVLDAQLAVTRAKLQKSNALYGFYLARATLRSALGEMPGLGRNQ